MHPEITKLEKEGLRELYQHVKWVRIYYKKTLPEMAALMGISPKKQIAIEQGKKDPWNDYLKRITDHFPDIRKAWLIDNQEPKLRSYQSEEQAEPKTEDSPRDFFKDFPDQNLNESERFVLEEVKSFSHFLETRNLKPQVKRLLLQLLIQSIDQELERRQRAQPQSSED